MRFAPFNRTLLLSVVSLLLAATGLRAEVAADAQQAINKGILAAKQQDYLLAIRYFGDARKIAPDAPEIYYDLGLAESKIPGRELRAIAWFGAYVADNPSAPNVAAVKGEIDALDVKSQSNVSRLIKSVQEAASQTGSNQEFNLGRAAGLWAGAGDMTTATKIVDHIQDVFRKSGALETIAEAQVKAGNIAGALKTAEQIQHPESKGEALVYIARTQVKAGDTASAFKTFALAKANVDLIQSVITKHGKLEAIACDQADAGDVAGAQNTLAAVGPALKQPDVVKNDPIMKTWPEDKYYIDLAREHIARAQARAGDIAGAQKTYGLIQAAQLKPDVLKAIEQAKTKAGAANGPSVTARPAIAAPVPTPPVIPATTASDWIGQLDAEYGDCPLNTDLFLDLAGYLKGQRSDNPQELFSALRDAAEKIIIAQNVIDRMLKQQKFSP